jgi:hypothetical protein
LNAETSCNRFRSLPAFCPESLNSIAINRAPDVGQHAVLQPAAMIDEKPYLLPAGFLSLQLVLDFNDELQQMGCRDWFDINHPVPFRKKYIGYPVVRDMHISSDASNNLNIVVSQLLR